MCRRLPEHQTVIAYPKNNTQTVEYQIFKIFDTDMLLANLILCSYINLNDVWTILDEGKKPIPQIQ